MRRGDVIPKWELKITLFIVSGFSTHVYACQEIKKSCQLIERRYIYINIVLYVFVKKKMLFILSGSVLLQ